MMSSDLHKRLVLACRVLADQGHGDVVLGHVSVRMPEEGRILMKGAGRGLEEVTVGDLVEIDLEGVQVAGPGRRHSEYPIHTEIYRARPEIASVVHTHPPHAVALSATGDTIRAVGHEGALFAGIPVFDETTALIRRPEQGAAVASCLGSAKAALLRNHGIVTVGSGLEQAVVFAVLLEKAARIQLLAGGNIRATTEGTELSLKAEQIYHEANIVEFFEYFARRVGTRPGD